MKNIIFHVLQMPVLNMSKFARNIVIFYYAKDNLAYFWEANNFQHFKSKILFNFDIHKQIW